MSRRTLREVEDETGMTADEIADSIDEGRIAAVAEANKLRRELADTRQLVTEALIHFESYPAGSDQQGVLLLRRALHGKSTAK